MQQVFPPVNSRQFYIGRAMEPQLAKWHQINAEQNQCILQISNTFLRTATPITREAEEKRAQAEIEKVLTEEQDHLIRNEIWFAINATRLPAHLVHDQLGLDTEQRRRIDDVRNKLKNEVRENNGWLADGTDSYKQVLGDLAAVLNLQQREQYLSKLQDPVFDSGYRLTLSPVDPPAQLQDSTVSSTLLLDVLQQDMERELSRFPLIDHYREDLRLLEGGGLEVLEKPVQEDREQYANDSICRNRRRQMKAESSMRIQQISQLGLLVITTFAALGL